ncbi:DUF4309 domain-containing protein [Sporosarcina trichiuri]|uniref:DUF4309 domain-containing protein n=1 Tax=Sporosarcina trichiuri TaxID=3056445 RepID=UPI0025B54FEB|nr:DUF4309 domain-containing protein [Sporosarcina sp. 0.2-SM1T-5]WJY28105.1 DUF4309 domain-containing protein [Sporosarcina sp. 0.2-SM1T-5]
MNRRLTFAAVLLTGTLAACSGPDNGEPADGDNPAAEQPAADPDTSPDSTDSMGDEDTTADRGESSDSGSTSDDPAASEDDTPASDGSSFSGHGTSDSTDGNGSEASDQNEDSSDDPSVADEQKQMAIDTLNDLVADGKKGKVYALTDTFCVGKTTQTDVYNEIGQPERQDTFDRYTGSMGRASYDLRYDKNGVLVEARYLGTNVERQTNLGGITSEDLVKQLGQPDEERSLPKTKQVNYTYDLGSYKMQFILNDKDTTDHVNLLLK